MKPFTHLVLLTSLIAGCAGGAADDPGSTPDSGPHGSPVPDSGPLEPTNLLTNSDFTLTAWDSGTLANSSLEHAPWGAESWGVQAAVFDDGANHALGMVHAALINDAGYLWAREDRGKYGFIRFIQGDVWGGGYFGGIPWKQFEPIEIEQGKRVKMSFDVLLLASAPVGTGNSWLLEGLNLWITGPGLPAGPDKTGHKGIVMDLVVENTCTAEGCGLRSFVDDYGFHYQAKIAAPTRDQWTKVTVDITTHLNAAWDAFDLPISARAGLAIHQAEFVVEVSRMEAAAMVDNIQLWVE